MTDHHIHISIGTNQMVLGEDDTLVVSIDGRDQLGITRTANLLIVGHWPDGEEWKHISTADLNDLEVYDITGTMRPRGRCDTCGAPCLADSGACSDDENHQVART